MSGPNSKAKFVLVLALLVLVLPLRDLYHYLQPNQSARNWVLSVVGVIAAIVCLVCLVVISESATPVYTQAAGGGVNGRGEEVFPLPAQLVPYLPSFPALLDEQARHGGIRPPIHPDTLLLLIQLQAEYRPSAYRDHDVVEDFMYRLIASTTGESGCGGADGSAPVWRRRDRERDPRQVKCGDGVREPRRLGHRRGEQVLVFPLHLHPPGRARSRVTGRVRTSRVNSLDQRLVLSIRGGL